MDRKTDESDAWWKDKRIWAQIWKTGISRFVKGKTSNSVVIDSPTCHSERWYNIAGDTGKPPGYDPPWARQLNLGDLQRWLPASIILCCWVFPVCLLSHYWEYLKKKAKKPKPTKQEKKPHQPQNANMCKKPLPNKIVIHYFKHCGHRL